MRKLLLISALLAIMVSCGRAKKVPTSSAEIRLKLCGKYQGKYNDGTEFIEILPDGGFSQRFVQRSKTVYDLQGRWTLETIEDHYSVRFEPFMDSRIAILNGKSPEKVSACTATFYDDEPKIWFFREIGYSVTKQSREEDK